MARPDLTWTVFIDGVVPFTVEWCLGQVDHFQFIIAYTNAFGVDVGVQFGADGQSTLGGSAANEIDDDFMADQWLAPPVHADVAEHAVFDLIPFARAWREVADRNT